MDKSTSNPGLEELFCAKVGQMAADLAALAKALATGAPSAGTLQKLYVIAHSLHGAGTMYGFPCVSELGASLEGLINAVRSGQLAPAPEVSDLVDSCAAALREVACPGRANKALAATVSETAWKCECALHRANAPADPTS